MTKYNYIEAMKADILRYIEWNIDLEKFESLEELEEQLNEDLWTEDGVTGNASGSYTFDRYKSEEYICHNLDLLAEALDEFGGSIDILHDGAEAADVTIRCYLLGHCIAEALAEIEDEFDEIHRKEEEHETTSIYA